jgi:uncharacterized protein YndB with AHSA1/START domain
MGGIRLEFDLVALPERVWPFLTEPAYLSAWFAETDFVAEPGRRFMIWPTDLPGIDGPISAVALTVSAPHRLVMGWQSPTGQTTMTWTLLPTTDGSRLRVVEWGQAGTDEIVREQTLSRLFDVSLRSLVQREAAVPPDDLLPRPLRGEIPFAAPAAAGQLALDQPDETGRRRQAVLIGLIALVVLAAAALWLLWPPVPAGGDGGQGLDGRGGIGGAPGGPSTSQTSGAFFPVGGGLSTPNSPGSQSPLPTVSETGGGGPGSSAASAYLVVTSSSVERVLAYEVTVTITNNGNAPGEWRAVGVALGAVDLAVTVDGSGVTHVAFGAIHCFYPNGSASIARGGSYTFGFTISVSMAGLLGGDPVKGVALDTAPCL